MITIFSIGISIGLILFILYLIYKGRLKEEFSILWLFLSLFILVFSVWRDGLDILADFFGVYYAPSLLFIFAFLIIILIIIHLSITVSKLKDNVRTLTQDIGLLKNRIKELEKEK